ncbi:MAG: hypothetical protein ACYCXR_05140 [Coriobacteriia bacterium]
MPQYAAPVPPENMPPSYAAQASPPPKKKNKTLIIVLVILGVLLLCCVGGAVGAFTIFSSDTTESSGGIETEVDAGTESEAPADATDEGAPADETGGLAEWTEFQPELADPSIYAQPTAAQSALIDEIHAKLYPDFEIEDTLAEPGGEDAENYYPDMLYVKATLASNPDVRIAYYMWTDSEASAEAGVHLTQDNTESYETLAQSSSGLSYIYDHENLAGLMEGTVDERIVGALTQAEQDFPGYVAMMVGEDGDNIGVVLTRWNAFADLELGLAVTYAPDGSGWTVSDITDW